MASALIFSSFVASSRVGGMIQALAFGALGVEARLIPTVLFGRHPGLGPPGGGAVGPETFKGVLEGAEAQNALSVEVILTGYFALPEQVQMAAAAIQRARTGASPPLVLVDPILGDDGPGLYVKPEVEAAVRALLVPLADMLAPNRWELERLTGRSADTPEATARAARALGPRVLVSSAPSGADQIGVLLVEDRAVWTASHARALEPPRGTGDLLKALFAAALMEGSPPQTALARAAGGVADAVEAAIATGASDLPVAALGDRFRAPLSRVTLSTLALEADA